MKTTVRLISASTILLGLVFAPVVARAEAVAAEDVTSPSEEKHASAREMFERALAGLELRPEQREAIDELKSEAEMRHAPSMVAKRDLAIAVADQVEKGSIDRCTLAPHVQKLAAAKAQAHPGDRTAFEKLHSILTTDQRAKVVESLQREWQSFQRTHEPGALANKMARELGLTEEQKSTVEQILSGLKAISEAQPERAAHRERWSRLLTAFKSDRFVLDELMPSENMEEKITKRMDGYLWAAEAIIPVLTTDQRAVLAHKIREKVSGHTTTGGGGMVSG